MVARKESLPPVVAIIVVVIISVVIVITLSLSSRVLERQCQRPRQRPESENHSFSFIFLRCVGQNLDFRSPQTLAVIPTKRELMKPLPDQFRDENVLYTQKRDVTGFRSD